MKRRYPRPATGGELFPELIDILLEGWNCPTKPEHLEGDPFRVFFLGERDMADIWRRHRPALMAEAKRRGIAEPMGLRFERETA